MWLASEQLPWNPWLILGPHFCAAPKSFQPRAKINPLSVTRSHHSQNLLQTMSLPVVTSGLHITQLPDYAITQ